MRELACNLYSFALVSYHRAPLKDKRFTEKLFGKLFADRGYVSQDLFERLFVDDLHLVTKIKKNMKNKLMPMWDKIMLRKRYVIECINYLLKDKANIVHSRHRSVHNFIMNLCAGLAAYCFFENSQSPWLYILKTQNSWSCSDFLSRTRVFLQKNSIMG